MRLLLFTLACGLWGCSPSPTVRTDVTPLKDSTVGDMADIPQPIDTVGDVWESDLADIGSDDELLTLDDLSHDVDAVAKSESHFQLKNGDVTLMNATFEGYEPNVFGAQVYGKMLTIWASDETSLMQILVRLDQVGLPGSVNPKSPGGAAWVLFFHGEKDFYTTHDSSAGMVTIETCPNTPGVMVVGKLEGVVLAKLGGMFWGLKVEASFEVLLGDVNEDVSCLE